MNLGDLICVYPDCERDDDPRLHRHPPVLPEAVSLGAKIRELIEASRAVLAGDTTSRTRLEQALTAFDGMQ